MALFRKFFFKKPPEGLLEISERVYVFECCFTTDVLDEDETKIYIGGIALQLEEVFPDASVKVFNFREGENRSLVHTVLSEYDMTVMDYPTHEFCPVLPMEMIRHFLRSVESWLSAASMNLILMHCERGGWAVLAFMLAALQIQRRQCSDEQKALDLIYKQAPREVLWLHQSVKPLPSQLRYLRHVPVENVGSLWPPLDRALTLDSIILRGIPRWDAEGGCRPVVKIYGQDPAMVAVPTPALLSSTSNGSEIVRHYKQENYVLVRLGIGAHIQGDVVLECITLDDSLEHEELMFRIMFNTAFVLYCSIAMNLISYGISRIGSRKSSE